MALKRTNPVIEDLKKLLTEGKIAFGADVAVDRLKKGKLAKIFIASNYPQERKDDINHYAEMTKTEVIMLEVPNDELGIICKKPFRVSVLSVEK